MSPLLCALVLHASVVMDPRGFRFAVPDGFEPFPNFQPTATKLYAFGKNLGTPEAVTLTVDLLDGPVTPGQPSRSCGLLLNSINRTVGKPLTQSWQGSELNGLRMLMTHTFGEVVVLCLDVPIAPTGLSVMVSGKPANEAALQQTFEAVLSSLENSRPRSSLPFAVAAVITVILLGLGLRRSRRGK